MTVSIDKNLNLLITVDREGGEALHVHCQPISYDVFQRYWLVLSKVYTALTTQGLGAIGGAVCAHLLLEDVARNTLRADGRNWWEGADGVEHGLLDEIVRLSNVMTLEGEQGWQPTMLSVARSRGLFSDEEWGEVLAQATFFSVIWRTAPKRNRVGVVRGASFLNGSLPTSWDTTELRNFLMMWTAVASIGLKPKHQSARR